jgi:hypothetical protein
VQIDHYKYTDFKVQRKGWFGWKDVDSYHLIYNFTLDLRFNTFEEADEWIMKQQKPKEKIVNYVSIEE